MRPPTLPPGPPPWPSGPSSCPPAPRSREKSAAGFGKRPWSDSISFSSAKLFAGDGHAVDAQGGRRRGAAKFQIVANLRDIVQHVFEIAGDRDFLHRKSEFAVFNPQPAGAAGKVSRDQVHAKAEEFSHIQPAFDFADNLLRCSRSRLKERIPRADAGIAGQPARGVSRGLQA